MAASHPVRRRLTISLSEVSGSRSEADRFDIQIAARFASSNQFDSNSRSRSNSGSDGIFSRHRPAAAERWSSPMTASRSYGGRIERRWLQASGVRRDRLPAESYLKTQSFRVSDSGNRIETILTSISYVPSSFSIAGSIKETVAKATSIRQSD